MTIDQLNEIFISDFNLDTIVSAQQSWNPGAKYFV